jgi:phenylacetate-CoA ligase
MQHIKNENVKFIVEYLNKEKFVFFSGYPSIIYALAELISANDIVLTSPPKIIFTGAEKLYGYQKKLLSEVFQCDIADQYGFSEGAGNASTCQYGLYHEDFEFGHLEYIQPSLNSDQGEILSTGFSNLAMPLIRYQVGDSAIKSDGFCQCGRKSKTFRSFIGRIEDYIITPEGTKIQRFDYLFKETNNIKECQIVQRRLNEITFRIIPRKRYSISEDEDALKKLVKEWISPFIEVYFEYPKEIERSSSGKFVAVKSLIDKQ